MSPGELFRTLRRRWYVLVLAAALAAVGALQVLRPTTTYVSTAIVVLKPPVTSNQPNQLANLQPPLAAVSLAVVEQLDSADGEAELRAAGVAGTYRLIPRNSGTSVTPRYLIPSLQVQAEHTDPATADRSVRAVVEVYGKHLSDMQAEQKIPAAGRMSVTLLVAPSAVAQLGTKSRGLAGTALLALVAGVACAVWTDRFLAGRARRRRVRAGAGDGGQERDASPVPATAAAR
ncbi:hypothetical protein [Streptomyces sp. NBC_01264]|uniref:hypothetical protein n=1 Tax=Streptomyces sp. NBC_01264 TaxID=2903804 RepID=UPI0022592591|nr:hypothetical protein [Streptomyces sp. NBC_01264]MCX4782059.1 hypothetical protein [Streptomyces sp. NBC_01264]